MIKITNIALILILSGVSFAAGKIKTISIQELSKMISSKEKTEVFDANVESTRKHVGIIPGAKLLDSPTQYDTAKVLPSDKSRKIVFYCANTMCTSSDMAAKRAIEAGYKNVFVMKEGVYGWKKAGMKLERTSAEQANFAASSISPKDAQALVKNNQAIVVDVREAEERHEIVPESLWFAMSKANNQQEWESFKKQLPQDKTIIFYCAAGFRSKKVSEKLAAEGLSSAYFKSVDQWKSEGLPAEKGPAQD